MAPHETAREYSQPNEILAAQGGGFPLNPRLNADRGLDCVGARTFLQKRKLH